MGVPVLTLAGGTHAGRVGNSLLRALDMQEWIVQAPEDYIDRAAAFAADPGALTRLRDGLRRRMLRSVLCNGPAFAGRFEDACRTFWNRWCNEIQAVTTRSGGD